MSSGSVATVAAHEMPLTWIFITFIQSLDQLPDARLRFTLR